MIIPSLSTTHAKHRLFLAGTFLTLFSPSLVMADERTAMKLHPGVTTEATDPHAHHKMMMMHKPHGLTSKWANYKIPDVKLVRADGTKVRLLDEIDTSEPVILDFIFTSCTTICPVLSQTFAEVQKRLGGDADHVQMVSISIDPEQDTPSRLVEYAKRYNAGPQWRFYTGTVEDSVAVQKAFDIFRGDKMNHEPVTYVRGANTQRWLRLEGFATPDHVIKEYRQLVAAN